MSLDQLHNVVLLFSNPTWTDGITIPSTVVRNITAIDGKLAYTESTSTNLTTISSKYAEITNGLIQGLLYVPELQASQSCYNWTLTNLPTNVVHRSDLPPTNYKKIAIAPWVNIECTNDFLSVARTDGVRAFIFYRPGDSTDKPPPGNNVVWSLNDGFKWKTANHFPVYAVSSKLGENIIDQLAIYNGAVSSIPNATEIIETYTPGADDYIRVWTQLEVSTDSTLPKIWVFILIILAIIICVVGSTSLIMHLIQSRRRTTLRKRVQSGEVDLEALGIKRLTVPHAHVEKFPRFTYDYNGPVPSSMPSSPRADTFSLGGGSLESSRRGRSIEKAKFPLDYQPTCQLCARNFVNKETRIREIPCGHIFHPQCIDVYLTTMSSLCPLCKACMLPKGYCPPITNGMVRRERQIRKVRERVDVDSDMESGLNVIVRHRMPEASNQANSSSSESRQTTVRTYSARRTQRRSSSQPQLPTVAESAPPPDYEAGNALRTPDSLSWSPTARSPTPQSPLLRTAQLPSVIRSPSSPGRRSPPTQPSNGDLGIELVTNPQHLQPIVKEPPHPGEELAPDRISPTSSTRRRMQDFAGPELGGEQPNNRMMRVFRKVFPGF